MHLRTNPRRGTTIELLVPTSLTSLDALLVEAGGVAAAIPLDAVRKTLRVAASDVVRSADGDSIVYEGKVIPFAQLGRSLRGNRTTSGEAKFSSVVVVEGANALAAVSVDRLLGSANLVVRALPPMAPADPVVAGASLDAEGLPRLVLEPGGIVAFALGAHAKVKSADSTPAAPILVIDDSLTTRILEQSILESAGYEVELATSAEEALEMAALRRYALFLVDVEMPGMDGFTFIEKIHADPALRAIPAILVSSRNAPEDFARGRAVGARAYVVKTEFDQARLLDTIRGFLA